MNTHNKLRKRIRKEEVKIEVLWGLKKLIFDKKKIKRKWREGFVIVLLNNAKEFSIERQKNKRIKRNNGGKRSKRICRVGNTKMVKLNELLPW
jgi:hypothetical protein